MSRAYIIVGGNTDTQKTKISQLYSKLKPDHTPESDLDTQILTTKTSLKIEEIRNLSHFLSLKPFNKPPKIALILDADKMTIEAQNAFLKLLEEPPGETVIILVVNDSQQVLPTVVSRCQQILLPLQSNANINPEEKKILEEELLRIFESNDGERIKILEKITNKEMAVDFCKKQIYLWREILLKKPTKENLIVLRHLQKTLKYLQANVNFRLALENLLFSYPKAS